MGTNFAVGDDVLVMQNETNDEKSGLPTELHGRWLGRIIEIRALDQVNVFILVNWYNRPEDLAKGRAPHHSMNEILATNDVDVIAPSKAYVRLHNANRVLMGNSISRWQDRRRPLDRIRRDSAARSHDILAAMCGHGRSRRSQILGQSLHAWCARMCCSSGIETQDRVHMWQTCQCRQDAHQLRDLRLMVT